MKKKLITIIFLIFLILCITPASAADITYTFNHSACAKEDPAICICDDYDPATDTCTINTEHDLGSRSIPTFLYLNFDNLNIAPSGFLRERYYDRSITINTDNTIISGTISTSSIDITSSSVHVTSTGTLQTGRQIYSREDTSITITAPNINIEGTLDSKSNYQTTDITIQSTNLDISGTVISKSAYKGNFPAITIKSINTTISGNIEIGRGYIGYPYTETSTLIIESGTLDISGTVGGGGSSHYPCTKLIISARDLYISGTIQNKGINSYSNGYRDFSLDGRTSISAHNITLSGAGKIETGTYSFYTKSPVFITYCTLTPPECEDALGCSQITGDGELNLNNNCQVTATCQSGDGCIASDPFSGNPCAIPDPDCPAGTTGIPVPTFLSLQGTVTDLDDNPVTGAIEITKISMCSTDACSTPTPVTIPHQAHTFENGIVNLLIGSYDLIPNQRYIMELNLTSASKTDTINMKFSA